MPRGPDKKHWVMARMEQPGKIFGLCSVSEVAVCLQLHYGSLIWVLGRLSCLQDGAT